MSEPAIKTEADFERETIERLLKDGQSETTVVDGTTSTQTNINIDQAIKGLEYLQKKKLAGNPFAQIGIVRTVPPGIE